MTSRQLAAEKQNRLTQAMFALKDNEHFRRFMELLADLKDDAVTFSVSHEGIQSERVSLAAKGEVRAYLNIIGAYESYKLAGEQTIEQAEEARAREAEEVSGNP